MKPKDNNTESQILEAAEKLFFEQGYAKTTTAQIAKLAGCNQALVHYYYRTKDNLFEKIFDDKVRLMTANFLTIGSAEVTFEEKISSIVGLHFDFLQQNPQLASFILREVMSNPERLSSLFDKLQERPKLVVQQLDVILKSESEKGNIRPISFIDLAFVIISLNIVPFLAMPMLNQVMNLSDATTREMLAHRRRESIETVLARLRK